MGSSVLKEIKSYNGNNISEEMNEVTNGQYEYEMFSYNNRYGYERNNIINLVIKDLGNYDFCSLIDHLQFGWVIEYYEALYKRLDILIKEGVFRKETIEDIAICLVTEINECEAIKLGLILLRFAESDDALDLLIEYAMNNEYIFYAIEAIKAFDNCNSIIFDIAKISNGYGKIIAINNLEPINDEIKKWIILNGTNNDFKKDVLAKLCFNKVDYLEYYLKCKKSNKNYKVLTETLKLLYESPKWFVENINLEFIKVYCKYFYKFENTFDNIYVMCSLLSLFYKKDGEKTLIENISLSIDEEEFIDKEIEKFLKGNYIEILKDTLDNNYEKISKVIDVALALEIQLKFDDFKSYLELKPFDINIYEYIMNSCDKHQQDKLIEFTFTKLNFIKFDEEEQVSEDEELSDEDLCFYIIVSNSSLENKDFIKVNLYGLKSKYFKIKVEALDNFINNKELINEEILDDLEDDTWKEIYKELKCYILDSSNIDSEDADEYQLDTHVKDVYLQTVTIKLINSLEKIVEYNLSVEDMVMLSSDKKKNEIDIISKSGYKIGCFKTNKNNALKNLVDYGKILYGKIIEIDNINESAKIEVFLSYEDILTEVSDTFNMIVTTPLGYIN